MSAVLIAGRNPKQLALLEEKILVDGVRDVTTRQVVLNGNPDPLQGIRPTPSALILLLTDQSTAELEALVARTEDVKVPLLVVSDALEPMAMRLAMQAGASDFLKLSSDTGQITTALSKLLVESRPAVASQSGRVVSFLNTAGGSGATTLAVNTACLLQCLLQDDEQQNNTCLLDLDLQFAGCAQYLDQQPRRDLVEALARVEEIDAIALQGYLTEKRETPRLMCADMKSTEFGRASLANRLPQLIHLLKSTMRYTVIDVPNQLNRLALEALRQSDLIYLVMQQSLPGLRNASRLIELLQSVPGISIPNIQLIVNRHRKGYGLELPDIYKTLPYQDTVVVPNDYRSVSESIDTGLPIAINQTRSPLVKALAPVVREITGEEVLPGGGNFFSKTVSSLLRS